MSNKVTKICDGVPMFSNYPYATHTNTHAHTSAHTHTHITCISTVSSDVYVSEYQCSPLSFVSRTMLPMIHHSSTVNVSAGSKILRKRRTGS